LTNLRFQILVGCGRSGPSSASCLLQGATDTTTDGKFISYSGMQHKVRLVMGALVVGCELRGPGTVSCLLHRGGGINMVHGIQNRGQCAACVVCCLVLRGLIMNSLIDRYTPSGK
jgi:hypothetical protein